MVGIFTELSTRFHECSGMPVMRPRSSRNVPYSRQQATGLDQKPNGLSLISKGELEFKIVRQQGWFEKTANRGGCSPTAHSVEIFQPSMALPGCPRCIVAHRRLAAGTRNSTAD